MLKIAAQPPSDFVPPPQPKSSVLKYILFGCGGCLTLILVVAIATALLGYKGYQAFSKKMIPNSMGNVVNPMINKKPELAYEAMRKNYRDRVSKDEFIAQLKPYEEKFSESTLVGVSSKETDRAGEDVMLLDAFLIGKSNDFLILKFVCYLNGEREAPPDNAQVFVPCPLEFTGIEEKHVPLNDQKSVLAATAVIDDVKKGRRSGDVLKEGALYLPPEDSLDYIPSQYSSFFQSVKDRIQDDQTLEPISVRPGEQWNILVTFADSETKKPVVDVPLYAPEGNVIDGPLYLNPSGDIGSYRP